VELVQDLNGGREGREMRGGALDAVGVSSFRSFESFPRQKDGFPRQEDESRVHVRRVVVCQRELGAGRQVVDLPRRILISAS